MINTFDELGLPNNIIEAISELGFEKPTPVQQTIIPLLLRNKKQNKTAENTENQNLETSSIIEIGEEAINLDGNNTDGHNEPFYAQFIGEDSKQDAPEKGKKSKNKKAIADSDIVCLAQTGTGKTAAFGLPTLSDLDMNNYQIQALVLAPTRELCRQITQDLKNYAKYIKGFTVVDVYGGAGIDMQIKALKREPQIVVATPGRLLDLLHRRALNLNNIKTLILDEADEMLNMGFKDDLDAILETTPSSKQILLFSATLPMEVEKIAKNYMNNPQIITVGERNKGADNVKHYYFTVHEKDRYLALKRIADYYPDIYGIIFCRTRRETGEIASALIKDGYNADALHGDLSQQQRDIVMNRFKNKTLSLLVATDVAARGIDVNNLTHVINYNLPDEVEQYTHRSGRTGRADKSGKSIVIINSREQHKIKRIEKMIGKSFAKAKIPTGNEVCSKQMLSLIEHIEAVEVKKEMQQYLPLVEERWAGLNREEIITKLLSMEFNRFLEYYKNAPDLNVSEGRDSRDRDSRNDGYERDRRDGRRDSRRDGDDRGGRSRRDDRGDRGARSENGSRDDRARGGSRDGRERRDDRSRDRNSRSNSASPSRDVKKKEEFQVDEKDFKWVRLSIGDRDKVTTRHIIRMLTTLGVSKKGIGRIEVQRDTTLVSVAGSAAEKVVNQTKGTMYRGKQLDSDLL